MADEDNRLDPKFFFAAILSGLFLKYDEKQLAAKEPLGNL